MNVNSFVDWRPVVRACDVASSDCAFLDNGCIDMQWVQEQRQAMTLRAIANIKTCFDKAKSDFELHGGDIIFLLRNAIFRGQGDVKVSQNDEK